MKWSCDDPCTRPHFSVCNTAQIRSTFNVCTWYSREQYPNYRERELSTLRRRKRINTSPLPGVHVDTAGEASQNIKVLVWQTTLLLPSHDLSTVML